jgi:tetratricopeptide (TPR) repeat protein
MRVKMFNREMTEEARFGCAEDLISNANSHLKSGQLEDGIWYLQKAVEACPQHVNGWRMLGEALQQSGASIEAQNAFNRAVELNPHSSSAWNGLSQYQRLHGEVRASGYSEFQASQYKMNEKHNSILLILAAVPFLIISAILFQHVAQTESSLYAEIQHLPSTKGEVTWYSAPTSRRQASVDVSYNVNGKNYRLTQKLPSDNVLGLGRKRIYHKSEQVKVRYYPSMPSNGYLDKEKLVDSPEKSVPGGLATFGSIMLFLSVIGLLKRK